jgi:hypothetical protein
MVGDFVKGTLNDLVLVELPQTFQAKSMATWQRERLFF